MSLPDWYDRTIYGRDVTHREAISVACPKCEAERGRFCMADTGWRAKTHARRVKLAEKMKAKGSLHVIRD